MNHKKYSQHERSNPMHDQDRTQKQKNNHIVEASIVLFSNVHFLHNTTELIRHIQNIITAHGNADDEIKQENSSDSIRYSMGEKNLALSIARNVEHAFKQYQPIVTIHNPVKNEFWRITVEFQKPKSSSK